jgi:hypothetical protein
MARAQEGRDQAAAAFRAADGERLLSMKPDEPTFNEKITNA